MSRTQRAFRIAAQFEIALATKRYEVYAETTGGRGMDQLDEVREAVADLLPKISSSDIVGAFEDALSSDEFDEATDEEACQAALNHVITERLVWRDEWPDAIACGVRNIDFDE